MERSTIQTLSDPYLVFVFSTEGVTIIAEKLNEQAAGERLPGKLNGKAEKGNLKMENVKGKMKRNIERDVKWKAGGKS